jgi:hypothetical protein
MMDEWHTDSFSMTRFYCDCLEPEHALDICVERDSFGQVVQVSVETYMTRDLPWKNRLKMMWDAIRNRRVLLSETVIQVRDWEAFASASDCILRAAETTGTK